MSNSENLWRSLRADNLYTKSYEDFKVQFSDKESRDSLYSALKQDNLYTKSSSDFEDQFFKPSNTFRYTKHRMVKNKEEVVSSL